MIFIVSRMPALLTPYEVLRMRIEDGLVDAPCGDATVLICKPHMLTGSLPIWPYTKLGSQIIAHADLVLVRKPKLVVLPKPIGEIESKVREWRDLIRCPPWTHLITKSRHGSSLWDMMEEAGYESGFHHIKIANLTYDRVYLKERSLRALKVLVQ